MSRRDLRTLRLLLTVEEAAEQLGIGRTLMYALVKQGAVESVQIGDDAVQIQTLRDRKCPVHVVDGTGQLAGSIHGAGEIREDAGRDGRVSLGADQCRRPLEGRGCLRNPALLDEHPAQEADGTGAG